MSELPGTDATPLLFDEAIDRTEMPDWFMPSARVGLVASEQMVRRATKSCLARGRPRRWSRCNDEAAVEWTRIDRKCKLYVWRHGRNHFIQRALMSSRQLRVEGLGFLLGPATICAHTAEEAKRLAEYYHLNSGQGGMLWFSANDKEIV